MEIKSKIQKMKLVNMLLYISIIIVLALMWLLGLSFNLPDSDTPEGAIGNAFAGLLIILLKFLTGGIASLFIVISLFVSLGNYFEKDLTLYRYNVTLIVFSIIQIFSISLFAWSIYASGNMYFLLAIAVIVLNIITIIINSCLIKTVKNNQEELDKLAI